MFSHSNTRLWILLLYVFSLSTGCMFTEVGSAQTETTQGEPIIETGDVTTGSIEIPTVIGAPDPTRSPEDSYSKPPLAYLSIDEVNQASGIGSYCWNSGVAPQLCVDSIGLPTMQTALEAHPLALLQFELPIEQIPDRITLTVYPAIESNKITTDQNGWQWWSVAQPVNQFALPLTQSPDLEVILPPGLNLLSLAVYWPDYGDVVYGFLVNVEPDTPEPTAGFWRQAEDPRTGIRFAIPCFWRAEFPIEDPTGYGAFLIANYSQALGGSLGRGEGVFAQGGIKIDVNYINPSQLGLPANAPLTDIAEQLMGDDITIEALTPVTINGQPGLSVNSYNSRLDLPGQSYLFALNDDLILLLDIVPGSAGQHPDIQGVISSFALGDAVAVQVPDTIPAGPPAGDGPYACMEMGSQHQPPPTPAPNPVACMTATDGPEAMACDIQTALLARDMDALQSLMADPFVIAYWQSEGRSSNPAEIRTELSASGLPADTSQLTFTTDRSQFPDLNGMPVDGVFGPNNNTALIIYSEGWGTDGQGAALLYLYYDAADGLKWSAMLYAGQSFD